MESVIIRVINKVGLDLFIKSMISNVNRTVWSTIDGVIGRVVSNQPNA